MEPEIEKFISNVVSRLKSEMVFASTEKEITRSKKNWDTVAKSTVGKFVKVAFQQSFPEEDLETAVYVESKGVSFELFLGDSKVEKKPYNLFGGLGIFPDIAILRPEKIMIELDNSGSSRQGLAVHGLRLLSQRLHLATWPANGITVLCYFTTDADKA